MGNQVRCCAGRDQSENAYENMERKPKEPEILDLDASTTELDSSSAGDLSASEAGAKPPETADLFADAFFGDDDDELRRKKKKKKKKKKKRKKGGQEDDSDDDFDVTDYPEGFQGFIMWNNKGIFGNDNWAKVYADVNKNGLTLWELKQHWRYQDKNSPVASLDLAHSKVTPCTVSGTTEEEQEGPGFEIEDGKKELTLTFRSMDASDNPQWISQIQQCIKYCRGKEKWKKEQLS